MIVDGKVCVCVRVSHECYGTSVCLMSGCKRCKRLIDGVARPTGLKPGLALHFVCRPGSAPVNHPPTKAQTVRLQPVKKVLLKTLWLRFIEYMKMILDKNENNEIVLDTELCVSRALFKLQ